MELVMNSTDVYIILKNNNNFESIRTFYACLSCGRKIKFSDSERKRVKAFYLKASGLIAEGEELSSLTLELLELNRSIDYPAAKIKWGQWQESVVKVLEHKNADEIQTEANEGNTSSQVVLEEKTDAEVYSYSNFFSSLKPPKHMKFTLSERQRLNCFKKKVRALIEQGGKLESLEQERLDLLSTIDYVAAVDRRAQSKLDKKKKSKRKKNKKEYPFKPTVLSVQESIKDKLESRKDLCQVGLGSQSSTVIPRVRKNEVIIDEHTKQKKKIDKHILYAAGWDTDGAFSK